jgi:hypothetical protein
MNSLDGRRKHRKMLYKAHFYAKMMQMIDTFNIAGVSVAEEDPGGPGCQHYLSAKRCLMLLTLRRAGVSTPKTSAWAGESSP